MDKLQMQSNNLVDENIDFIAKRFPNCITEAIDENGKLTKLVDFDLLKQELSKDIVEGNDERYTLNWAGKKQSILTANSPINATLRSCKEESVDFDNTKNLYIEGDNLDVLKLLRETYMSKVKMIYIDPPYNTGNDFVYEDDFASSAEDYLQASKSYDDQGNRMFQNNDNNGRFHSDWLSMMISRLKLSKDLLSDDGIIFISIDDNEVDNLKKICNEIYGESNFVAQLTTVMNLKGNNDEFGFAGTHEYTLVYMKNKSSVEDLNGISLTDEDIAEYEYSDSIGKYKVGATLMRTGEAGFREKRPKGYYPIYVAKDLKSFSINKEHDDDIEVYPITKDGIEMSWRRSPENLMATRNDFIINNSNNRISFYKKQRLEDDQIRGKKAKTLFYKAEYSSGNGTALIKTLFNGRLFDNPKPIALIKDFIKIGTNEDSLVLDFFSGSATTAHAVMQLNAEDGGNRKFIMVQLPEKCDEKSEAYKAGYKNICEIGKERIRRAGKKIKGENPNAKDLDIGFRDLKLDSSCMKDIYYSPNKTTQDLLTQFEDNIKEDRTPEDLLFQVMLDMGVLLSSEIKTLEINGKKVFNVNDGNLVCCFDKNIDDDTITQIAKMKPLYAVFRDSSMPSDSVAVNFDQIFETYSQTTTRKII